MSVEQQKQWAEACEKTVSLIGRVKRDGADLALELAEAFVGLIRVRDSLEEQLRQVDNGHDVHRAKATIAELERRLEGWRSWAQFVYLGGGLLDEEEDDEHLQRRVNKAHDAQLREARGQVNPS